MNQNTKVFVVYIAFFILEIIIHLACKAQIALSLAKKVTILVKYSDFFDVFSKNPTEIWSKKTRVNEHATKLEKGKQPFYRLIYSLQLVELEIFKTYIEINLTNNFIRALKLLTRTHILFVCKPNGSLCLCANYQGLNNLIIKNQYILFLMDKSLVR